MHDAPTQTLRTLPTSFVLDPTTEGADPTSGNPEGSPDFATKTHGPALGEGDLGGTLTFARYASDPRNDSDVVRLAGAWRTSEQGLAEAEDFVGASFTTNVLRHRGRAPTHFDVSAPDFAGLPSPISSEDPAADLRELGSRLPLVHVPLSERSVKVLTRDERWGSFELDSIARSPQDIR